MQLHSRVSDTAKFLDLFNAVCSVNVAEERDIRLRAGERDCNAPPLESFHFSRYSPLRIRWHMIPVISNGDHLPSYTEWTIVKNDSRVTPQEPQTTSGAFIGMVPGAWQCIFSHDEVRATPTKARRTREIPIAAVGLQQGTASYQKSLSVCFLSFCFVFLITY